MERKYNSSLVSFAKELRKNMTPEERHLWYDFLRSYPVRFTRQKIIENYIADFYCAAAAMVIEIDGSQHYEEAEREKDRIRTEHIEKFGLTVMRIPNNEVRSNFRGVCEYIDEAIKARMSTKAPSD